ncbi:MAG: hypothetical protein C0467_24050 [Planctomycetaceae bacterium]|nr:hypothetical protein [Planctomycetaceae bacterium]
MTRTITTLALLVLTATVATAQQGPTKKLDPRAVSPAVPNITGKVTVAPGSLKQDLTPKFQLKRNIQIASSEIVADEKLKRVTAIVRNTGQIAENTVAVRLGVADAVDGTLIFLDQTKQVGPIPAGGSLSVTFTGVDIARFRQQVIAKFGNQAGNNKVFIGVIADPANAIAETIENDNAGIKLLP